MEVKILDKNGYTKIISINRRKAVREKCLNCTAWSPGAVSFCDPSKYQQPCPLHPFRSGQGKQDAKDRGIAIRNYCLWCMNDQPGEVRLCSSKTCPLFPYRQYKVDRSMNIDPESPKSLPGGLLGNFQAVGNTKV